ncbi:beta-1,3-galactosyltransferase 1-like [Acanthaster planci]|uniref:Hexosyltransferase n=1 Tax=Acanthaster planci TaxID=133434 RepID=A0A8B7XXR8_ACAPL|nr:beta-1,3-galactosyltransferase 1-like [Acanthaster planci]
MRRMLKWQLKRLFVLCTIGFCFISLARVLIFLNMDCKNSLVLRQQHGGSSVVRLFSKTETEANKGKPQGNVDKVEEDTKTGKEDDKKATKVAVGPTVPANTIPLFSDDVINPHPYDFTITNSDACRVGRSNSSADVFLVLLVKCATDESLDRMQIRRTWGGVRQLRGRHVVTMFLVGQPATILEQDKLQMEDAIHHDLIQENFLDTYRNLTVKNMMGWRWIATHCPDAGYVASIDADMHLNLHNLIEHLENSSSTNLAQGHLKPTDKPMRNPEDKVNIKWYTPPEMYPEATYPPFLNGACYVMSNDVARRIFEASLHVRFLPWDDVFVGIVLKRLGVTPTAHNSFEQFKRLRRTRDYLKAFSGGIATGIGHHRKGLDSKVISVWDYLSKMHRVLDSFKLLTPPIHP